MNMIKIMSTFIDQINQYISKYKEERNREIIEMTNKEKILATLNIFIAQIKLAYQNNSKHLNRLDINDSTIEEKKVIVNELACYIKHSVPWIKNIYIFGITNEDYKFISSEEIEVINNHNLKLLEHTESTNKNEFEQTKIKGYKEWQI